MSQRQRKERGRKEVFVAREEERSGETVRKEGERGE